MNRAIVNISMPPELKKELDKVVKSDKYASRSEFIRHLLREDEALRALRASQKEIKEGKGKVLKSLQELR